MPHVHLVKLRPELSEQETNDQGTSEVTGNEDVANGYGDAEVNVNDNRACEHDSDISHFNCFFCVRRMIFFGVESQIMKNFSC